MTQAAVDTRLMDLAVRFREFAEREGFASKLGRRWAKLAEFRPWLAQEGLAALTWTQTAALYTTAGCRPLREFRENPLEEVREAIDFLLYDPISLEGRFNEVVAADGSYKLKGAGREFASYLLCVKDSDLFGVWDASAERGLKRLGLLPPSLRQGHVGTGYVEFLDILWRVRVSTGIRYFPTVDIFLRAIADGSLTA